MTRLPALLLLCALASGAPHAASAQDTGRDARATASADSVAVVRVVSGFHAALAAGDSARALSFLAPDARILEGGSIETRAQYAAHHLGADMAFAEAVPRERGPLRVTVRADVAWVASTSTARGSYRGREIDSRGAELAVLARRGGSWSIEAIHWSSR